MMSQEIYRVGAFIARKREALSFSKCADLQSMLREVKTAMKDGADFVVIRRIRFDEEAEG